MTFVLTNQEAKLEGQRQRLKRYQDYLKGGSSSPDPEGDEINDLLNRCCSFRSAPSAVTNFAVKCLRRNAYGKTLAVKRVR